MASSLVRLREAAAAIAVGIAVAMTWGGAAALAWSEWRSSDSWWRDQPVLGQAALRDADKRLFLEDALVVSMLALVVAVALTVALRRNRGAGLAVGWALAGIGAMIWLAGPLTEPRIDDAALHCTNALHPADEEAAGSLAIRGWSWSRFSEIVVRTDPGGTREATCS